MVMRQQLLFALQRPDGLLGRLLPGTSNGSQIEVTADPGAFGLRAPQSMWSMPATWRRGWTNARKCARPPRGH